MSHNKGHEKEKGLEEQMILRLPPQLADQVRKMLRAKQLNEEVEFEFNNDNRNAKFRVGKKKYDAYLVDLPCVVESHKTLDKTTYYKSADIGQMLVVQDPKEKQAPPPDYASPNGITPATRDIRRRKWRKPPDAAQLREIESEVTRLLKPADNETVEILNADDLDDMDDMGVVEEKVEPMKADTKIKIKIAGDGAMEAVAPSPADSNGRKSRKKGERTERRKKKEKEKEKETEVVPEEATPAAAATATPGVKKERKKKKKKGKDEGEQEAVPEAGAVVVKLEGEGAELNGEKKKRPKKRERKPKAKGTSAESATPSTPHQNPSTPYPHSPPVTPTTAPPFPFSSTPSATATFTQAPPAFAHPPLSAKISTPAFTANPFASSNAFSSPIATTPVQSHATPTSPPAPLPTSPPLPQEPPQELGYLQLVQQHRKLTAEVDQLRLKVADATNKYNILPNAVLKARQETKLKEVQEQYAQKVQELALVEQQMVDVQH